MDGVLTETILYQAVWRTPRKNRRTRQEKFAMTAMTMTAMTMGVFIFLSS